jgi:uncharacterized membrane protein YfcA
VDHSFVIYRQKYEICGDFHYLRVMDLSFTVIAILLASGVVVGFINTLAGGGSAISLTVFMALGLPVHLANGTNRVAITMQNLSATATFTRKRMIDWNTGLRLAIPAIVGSVVGAQIASTINDHVFQICLAVVMVSVLVFMIFGDRILRRKNSSAVRIKPLHYVLFFLIGIYSGYIFVGTGYLILLATMGLLHQNIVQSNVVKNFVVLLAVPFSLVVFIINGDVNWAYGLIHGAGNVVGAFLASHYAIGWGTKFLRWFVVVVVLICLADVVELISIREMVLAVIK